MTSVASSAANKNRAQPYPKRNSERKRHLHNELERKRREDLNNTFSRYPVQWIWFDTSLYLIWALQMHKAVQNDVNFASVFG
jgi:hypothetical protein